MSSMGPHIVTLARSEDGPYAECTMCDFTEQPGPSTMDNAKRHVREHGHNVRLIRLDKQLIGVKRR